MVIESDPQLIVLAAAAERRERRLIAAGKLNNEITKEFYGGVRTVEHHRSNICSKLGLSGKDALPTFALTHKAEI